MKELIVQAVYMILRSELKFFNVIPGTVFGAITEGFFPSRGSEKRK